MKFLFVTSSLLKICSDADFPYTFLSYVMLSYHAVLEPNINCQCDGQDISKFQALSQVQTSNWEESRLYAYYVHTSL